LKAIFKIKLFFTFILLSTSLIKCSSTKYISEGEYLLVSNSIVDAGVKIKNKELYGLLKQQPNKKFLGISPLYLAFYNLSKPDNEESYLKRIGEAPVVLNYRLARKSATQIELYYNNIGYLDAQVSFRSKLKKDRVKAIYDVVKGSKYTLNSIEFNKPKNDKFKELINDILKKSILQIGKTYNFKDLENERNRITSRIQIKGYYQFNKEFIYFLADTNQTTNKVDLSIVIKNIEIEENGTLLKQQHKVGVISEVNIHIDRKDNLSADTVQVEGINYLFYGVNPNYNLKRISEKIMLRRGTIYSKYSVDKTYQSISELKNFKKTDIEFNSLSSDIESSLLSADIYLKSGKKIAYSVEAEATSNPTLNEGISMSASISHYNIFRGSEHLQLTYKGSSNFKNINESGLVLDLTIPSLISPFKFNRVLNKQYRTKTIFSALISKQQRPEFTRNTITGSFGYQWNAKLSHLHKLSLFNLSYVNFEGDSTDLSNISEYLIAKDYSNQLIPTSSYTFSFNNQEINKLKNHSFLKVHLESSGSILYALAKPLNFNQIKDDDGSVILQENEKPSYTLNLWGNENIFTQYIKASLDYRYYWEIDKKNNLAFRAMGGFVYAFGNTNQVPFQKKFIAGGPNDLRGWRAYKRPTGMQNTTDTLYTGGLKLLSSIEYRFNLIKKLKGALFIDAGNIWEIEANNSKHEAANFHWSDFTKEIALDIGLGLRYDFQYFILRTDIGFPVREPNQSTSIQWDKININDSQLNIGLGYPF